MMPYVQTSKFFVFTWEHIRPLRKYFVLFTFVKPFLSSLICILVFSPPITFWVVLFIQNSLGIGIFEGVFTSMIVAAIPVKNEA